MACIERTIEARLFRLVGLIPRSIQIIHQAYDKSMLNTVKARRKTTLLRPFSFSLNKSTVSHFLFQEALKYDHPGRKHYQIFVIHWTGWINGALL